MQFDLRKMKKVRCRLLDSSLNKPVPGVVVTLAAAVGEIQDNRRIVIGSLASDSTGYVSFDLSMLANNGVREASGLILDAPAGGLHGLALLPKDIPLGDGMVIPLPIQLPPPTGRMCAAVPIPAIQAPDSIDYVASPYSFVSPPATKLGDNCCESLVPASAPVQQRRFIKVVVGQYNTPDPVYSMNSASLK